MADTDHSSLLESLSGAFHYVLCRPPEPSVWLYYRIPVLPENAASTVPTVIVPLMDGLKESLKVHGWWWLHKHDILGDAVRLRIHVPRDAAIVTDKEIRWGLQENGRTLSALTYEPEVRLFGGTSGIQAAHDFFCADSNFLGHWAALDQVPSHPIVPAGFSVALVVRLVKAVGLDNYEAWDVFERLFAARTFGTPRTGEVLPYQAMVRKIVASPNQVFALDFGAHTELIAAHLQQVDFLGSGMRRLYFEGTLECGLREYLVPLILFHWNRVGFGPRVQRNLSTALVDEYRSLVGRPELESSFRQGIRRAERGI